MNENVINEVTKETEKNKNEWKKPQDLYLNTANGNMILHEATSEKSFDKHYYTSIDAYKRGDTARRTKNVKLPLNREGELFTNVNALWEHLKSNCGYKPV